MGRHLMARFRQATPDDGIMWRNSTPLPHTARDIEHWNGNHAAAFNSIDDDWVSSALVNHGETRYGLEVMPDADHSGWFWKTHRQVGPDSSDPDHWEDMGTGSLPSCGICDLNEPYQPASDLVDERYYGYVPEPSEEGVSEQGEMAARRAAEEGFRREIATGGHGLGDYDINDIMRGEGM